MLLVLLRTSFALRASSSVLVLRVSFALAAADIASLLKLLSVKEELPQKALQILTYAKIFGEFARVHRVLPRVITQPK